MAGTIEHSWNGTVLTITSDSGTSSMDLKGDTGVRGPQGAPGITIFSGLTEEEKAEIIAGLDVIVNETAADLAEYETATDTRLAAIEEYNTAFDAVANEYMTATDTRLAAIEENLANCEDAETVAADLAEYETATDARLAAIEERLANGGGGADVATYEGTVVIE